MIFQFAIIGILLKKLKYKSFKLEKELCNEIERNMLFLVSKRG